MTDHSRAIVPLEVWAYSSPDLGAKGRTVDVGLLMEALVYYDSVLVNVSSQPQLAELLSWFVNKGLYEDFLALVRDGTITFYDWSFITAPVLKDGEYSLWNIQDPIQSQPNTFRKRFLYHPDVGRVVGNSRQRVKLYKACEGRSIEAKSEAFGPAIENARADFQDPRRHALIVQAFVDEIYRVKQLGRPPVIKTTITAKPDGTGHFITWNIDFKQLAAITGTNVDFAITTPLSAGAHCNRQLFSASLENCDLFLGRPMSRLVGDKLYETVRSPYRVNEIVQSLERAVNFPDIRDLVNRGELSLHDVLRIRAKADRFRRWLQTASDRDSDAIVAYHNEVATETGFAAAGRSTLRLFGLLSGGAVSGAIGAAVAGPVGGAVGGAIGSGATFLLDLASRMNANWRPVVFGEWMRNDIAKLMNDK